MCWAAGEGTRLLLGKEVGVPLPEVSRTRWVPQEEALVDPASDWLFSRDALLAVAQTTWVAVQTLSGPFCWVTIFIVLPVPRDGCAHTRYVKGEDTSVLF